MGLLEGKTQPAGGSSTRSAVDSFTAARLLSTRSTCGYADARFTRNVGKGDFSGDFFKVIVAMNERNDRNYHG